MRIDIVSLFPEFIRQGADLSILSRAQKAGVVEIHAHQLRDWAEDKHRTVDDEPYGGGAGLVLKVEVIARCVQDLMAKVEQSDLAVVLMEPQGELFDQSVARELAQHDRLIIACGRYEGFDWRSAEILGARRLSIGDYVLTGGELPALVVTDAVVRLLPGALGSADSLDQDSFLEPLLGYPQYTRPETFEGCKVPDVLLSGHHAELAAWRRKQQLLLTRRLRPDLFARAELKPSDVALLREAAEELERGEDP
ncbi:MAG: tRNA (guanosine(37)-N1)-methyltransferase TrmD [Armatimonadetes bacterium]|nr:tRNA (guanosine(37)-N1)-methyltransferase TrmD [Armatimonadota bacterium]